MAKPEFIKVHSAESMYGQKQLLHSELELLNLAKSMGVYKLLRGEELLLKIKLKSMIADSVISLAKLDKLLPKSQYKLPGDEPVTVSKKDKEKMSLEQEIAEIRRKITRLQAEM